MGSAPDILALLSALRERGAECERALALLEAEAAARLGEGRSPGRRAGRPGPPGPAFPCPPPAGGATPPRPAPRRLLPGLARRVDHAARAALPSRPGGRGSHRGLPHHLRAPRRALP